VTLRRLRAAGVRELAELERADPAVLARWLHASLPQARAFAAEAGKLARRIAEPVPGASAVGSRPRAASPGVLVRSTGESAREVRLAPGLLPGLDEALCARLAEHGVRTARVLAESAGLDLARRTGVPYSALLALARAARRPAAAPAASVAAAALPEPVRELVPFRPAPQVARDEGLEAVPAETLALPALEPESAGPFG
jgi:hypothetical protein